MRTVQSSALGADRCPRRDEEQRQARPPIDAGLAGCIDDELGLDGTGGERPAQVGEHALMRRRSDGVRVQVRPWLVDLRDRVGDVLPVVSAGGEALLDLDAIRSASGEPVDDVPLVCRRRTPRPAALYAL